MVTVNDVFGYFEANVPTYMKMDFDNPGFLAGDGDNKVDRVLVSLDITDEVIEEGKRIGAQLIVSHHPMFFELHNVSTHDFVGRKLVALLGAGMSAICLHTNLDAVYGGVNDALMDALGAETMGIIQPVGEGPDGAPYGHGRYGIVPEMSLKKFLPICKKALSANGLRYTSAGRPVHKIGVCGGAGGSMLMDAVQMGCDTFITGDVKHNVFIDARELGINIIDAGHFPTENVVMPVLQELLKSTFPELEVVISKVHAQPEQFYV